MEKNITANVIKFIFTAVVGINLFTINLHAEELSFGGFSELTYKVLDSDTSNSNTFTQGGIDIYMTKTIGPKTNMLAEVVFEISEENEAVLDPERIWIQHEISPWLKVKAGRVHTALGYWNETFHHGSWLQTSASRPIIFNFEDDGGILPVHSIGLELKGSGAVGSGELEYVVDIGNGRGVQADPPQTAIDADNDKAVTALVRYTTGNITVGAVFGTDQVASSTNFDANADGVAGDTRNSFAETITGGHLVWDNGKSQFIFEGFSVAHTYDTTLTPTTAEGDTAIIAYYAQASHQMGKYTPYARYGVISGDSDNYDHYLNFAAGLDKTRTTIGVRDDITYTSAIKYEYSTETIGTGNPESKFAVNWSYAW